MVSIAASFLIKSAAIESFTQQMPDWIANSATTTFQSSWTFWFEKKVPDVEDAQPKLCLQLT